MMDIKFSELGIFIFTGIIIILILGIGYNLNNNPEPYYAQWSQNNMNECYNINNNTLECYKLCREHGWVEDFCLKRHKT